MSGNRSELPEPALDRSQLPDRTPTGGRGTSRQQQRRTKREIANEIDVDREGVGTVDRLRGGIDAFLRSSGARQFGEQVREDFAGEADFVRPSDVAPNVDQQAIAANPAVAQDRRPAVAQRARQQTAADAEFIEAGDLNADVGPRGVSEVAIPSERRNDVASRARQQTAADAEFIKPGDLNADVDARGVSDIGIAKGRRDDVASRVRQDLAADDPFAKPGDFSADVTATGIESAGFTDAGARRRAGRQFEAETPLASVDPQADIEASGDGFALDSRAQERVAARNFEDQLDPFGSGELTPADIEPSGDGFGLTDSAQQTVAADRLDEQFPDVGIGRGDITDTGDGFGLTDSAQLEVGAAQLDEQLPDTDVTADDVTLEGEQVVFERRVY
jgi:hypothetical protein